MSDAKVIEALTHEEYAEIPAEHAGQLRKILTSPLAYARGLVEPDVDSDTLRLGRAIHTAVLQPQRFATQYVCWTGGVRRGKAWDQYVADAEAAKQTILKEDQLDLVVKISKAVRTHPIAAPLLSQDGRAELTIAWVHDRTGIGIKVRVDWLAGVLLDLKTCRDPAPRRFACTAAELGYHFQLALYADAVAAAGLGTPPVKIIAAQNREPHDVVVYSLDEDLLLAGRLEYERALDQLVDCRRINKWPGQAETEELPLKLPVWASGGSELELTYDGEVMS